MEDYAFVMETLRSLLGLLMVVGVVVVIIYVIAKAIPKNGDPTKRSVITLFGKPLNQMFGPVQESIVGYIEVPYEVQVKMPTVTIESKDDPPVAMTVEDMSFTLRISKKDPVRFIESGGQEAVTREAIGMFTAGLQEFAANNNKCTSYEELKKGQPYMLAAIVNYILKGDVVDMNDEVCVKKMHDLMASKNGAVEMPALGVTLIQMDIGRVAIPKKLMDANTAIAEQESENQKLLKAAEGTRDRLKVLQEADSGVTLADLQVQEKIRMSNEKTIRIVGATDSDKAIGGFVAVAGAFGDKGKGK
jgi:hypothetical protein